MQAPVAHARSYDHRTCAHTNKLVSRLVNISVELKKIAIITTYFLLRCTDSGSQHFNDSSPRRKIIEEESAFISRYKVNANVKVKKQPVSTSEYLLRHWHIVTLSTVRLSTVTQEHSSVLSLSTCSPMELQCCHVAYRNNYACL